ncbi:MAG: DUF5667 domain-containing protein [Candidatus Gribaldobacteria bacterium]|nr:DUF5667 domain-containing protein [Candidatus Gribaldobacteria bacterium]
MKKIIGLVILALVFILSTQVGQAQTGNQQYPEITTISCDASVKCPDVLGCYNFPTLGTKCAKVNPCSYYQCPANTQCLLAESIPAQVNCGVISVANNPNANTPTNSDITPQSLGVKNQSLLPTSPLYFLKEWLRGIKLFFTSNPLKKAELTMTIASEKLIELKNIISKNAQNLSTITKAGENYQKAVDVVKNTAITIKDKAEQNPQVNTLLGKLFQQQNSHTQLLNELQTQVASTTAPVIIAAKENNLVDFEAIMEKIGNNAQIQTAKQKIIDFKNQTAQPSSNNNNPVIPNTNPDTIVSTTTCPTLVSPSPDFCPNGVVVASYDTKGCLASPRFVPNPTPTTTSTGCACTMDYNPVCGSNGVTFSNTCQANCSGISIKYAGACQVAPKPVPVVGGDKDIHGCIPSAGYSWCGVKNKCLRIWEEDCPVNVTPPPGSSYNPNYNYNYSYNYQPNTYVGSPPPR